MRTRTGALLLGGWLFITACSSNTYIPVNDRYPMPWRKASLEEERVIEQVLFINNMRECEQYYIRQSRIETDDYLVACTDDNGESWDYHVVVLSTENVFEPEEDITAEPVVF